MPALTRRVATNLGVSVVDNNIRRVVATLSGTYATTDNAVNQTSLTIEAGGQYSYSPAATPTSIVVASVSGPVIADIQSASVTVGSEVKPAQSYSVQVATQLVLDDSLASIVFRNPQTYAVRLTLIQG